MAQLTNCWCGRFQGGWNERVECGANAAFNFVPTLNEFSAQAWVNVGAVGIKTIFARAATGAMQYAVQYNGSTGDIDIYIGGDTFSLNPFSLLGINVFNGWHHVVISVDTSLLRLYIDGQQCGSAQSLSGTTTAAAQFVIGARNDTSSTTFADYAGGSSTGYVDEVGLWSTALSAAEVLAIYNGGDGLELDDDSGSYVSSSDLEGWWRLGDGATENAGGTPTTTIADESGNGRNATYSGDTEDINNFYVLADDIPGGDLPGWCPLNGSSSSAVSVGPRLLVTRSDQGITQERTGFEGNLKRMIVSAQATADHLDPNVFVYENRRVIVGSPIRRPTFVRVATINDMTTLSTSAQQKFPHAYRASQAELLGETTEKLDLAWQEVQYQLARLSLDLVEFGLPQGTAGGTGDRAAGAGGAFQVDTEAFSMPPPAAPITLSSSSMVPTPIVATSSSSMALVIPQSSSSSEIVVVPKSSSSAWVDPYAFTEVIYLAADVNDFATRLAQDSVNTLFSDLGFIRFGRDDNPLRTWDAFLRFEISIPRCAEIESCYLIMRSHTDEFGQDVVLKVFDIYDDDSFTPISPFTASTDPPHTNRDVVWDRLAINTAGSSLVTPNLIELLQFFVDRDNYSPGDYFGLWIKEIQSDPGARRDASMPNVRDAYLQVNYRTDRWCSSSWMA